MWRLLRNLLCVWYPVCWYLVRLEFPCKGCVLLSCLKCICLNFCWNSSKFSKTVIVIPCYPACLGLEPLNQWACLHETLYKHCVIRSCSTIVVPNILSEKLTWYCVCFIYVNIYIHEGGESFEVVYLTNVIQSWNCTTGSPELCQFLFLSNLTIQCDVFEWKYFAKLVTDRQLNVILIGTSALVNVDFHTHMFEIVRPDQWFM